MEIFDSQFDDESETRRDDLRPILRDGEPYSAIGIVELTLMLTESINWHEIIMDPIPEKLKRYSNIQYGNGIHAINS